MPSAKPSHIDTTPVAEHEAFMRRCLHLASLGAGNTAPNPMVGAVLVYEGRIIGEGYHQQYGQAHAEVNCLRSVAEADRQLIRASTLYVSLEPCAHHGKTPPCADLIIREKIPRVVIGCRDPFPEVDGKGIEKLSAGGVELVYPVLEKESIDCNRRFINFHQKKRPFVILKWAASADHRMAGPGGERRLISNPVSNRMVHRWRTEEAGILIGRQTALLDNPALTARLWPGKNPIRIVVDLKKQLPAGLKLFDRQSPTIVINGVEDAESHNLVYKKIDPAAPFVPAVLSALYSLNVLSVLVEGGAKTLQAFIDAGLWDEVRVITNETLVIGAGIEAPVPGTVRWTKTLRYLSDTIGFGEPENR